MNSFEKLLGKGKKDQAAKKGKTPPKVKKMATTVQEVLDFDKITEDGIILTKGGNYSKIYKVEDANFITESDHKQWDILENYSKFINRFPDNVDVSIIIVNKRNTMEQLADNYHIKPKGDGLDEWRIDYNQIIDAKITEGRNDISKEKYIMLNVKESSLKDAQTVFSAADISLQESVKQINRVGVTQLDAIERLRVMHEILNGSDGVPFDVEYNKYISSVGKTIHFRKQSIDRLVIFGMTSLISSFCTYCIYLVKEKYTRCFLSCFCKCLTDSFCAQSDIHLYQTDIKFIMRKVYNGTHIL